MDLPVEAVIAGFVAMGGAISVLFALHVNSGNRCQKETTLLWKKVESLDKYQRDELKKLTEESIALTATAAPLLDRAVRALKRHEARFPGDDTPLQQHQV